MRRLVSRTATAPFDRLKIFLITRPPDLGGPAGAPAAAPVQGVKALAGAVARLYAEGGVRAFWVGQSASESQGCMCLTGVSTGNGLSLVKIFPVRKHSPLFRVLKMTPIRDRNPQSNS